MKNTNDELREIKIEKIGFSKTNPRKEFNKNSLNELGESIKSNGLIQPVVVRKDGSVFELVSGERRVRACKLIGRKTILAIVKNLTDEQVLEIQYIENLQRTDVHPLDEANFIAGMLETGKFQLDTIADKIGKTRAYVAQRYALTRLEPDVRKKYAAGEIELGHALLFAKFPADAQNKLLTYLKNSYRVPTVAELRTHINQHFMQNINDAPFGKKDALLLPEAGSCEDCKKRSGNAEDLFADFSGKNLCTDGTCYKEKVRLHIERQISRAEEESKPLVKLSNNYHGNSKKEIIGLTEYTPYDKPTKNTVRGIYVDGPERGKIINVTISKKEVEQTQAEAAPGKKPSIKSLLEAENEKIDEKRDEAFIIEARSALLGIQNPVDIETTVYMLRFIVDQTLGYDLQDYLTFPEKEPEFSKLDDEQLPRAVYHGFAEQLLENNDQNLLDFLTFLKIDYKEIRAKVSEQFPHVTKEQLKEQSAKTTE